MKIIPVDLNSKFKIEHSLLESLDLLSSARKKDFLRSCILIGFEKCKDPNFKFNPEFLAVSDGSVKFRTERYLIRLHEDSNFENEVMLHYSGIFRSRRVEFIRNCILMGFVLSGRVDKELTEKREVVAGNPVSKDQIDEKNVSKIPDQVSNNQERRPMFSSLLGGE